RASAMRLDMYEAAADVRDRSIIEVTNDTAVLLMTITTAITVTSSMKLYPRLIVPAPTGLFGGADRDAALQLQERLLADAAHVHDLFDFLEAAVLLTVLHDQLRRFRADARQRCELYS